MGITHYLSASTQAPRRVSGLSSLTLADKRDCPICCDGIYFERAIRSQHTIPFLYPPVQKKTGAWMIPMPPYAHALLRSVVRHRFGLSFFATACASLRKGPSSSEKPIARNLLRANAR